MQLKDIECQVQLTFFIDYFTYEFFFIFIIDIKTYINIKKNYI